MQEVAGNGGRTVFFVSHNMSAVHQLCTRAMLLHQGTLVQSGSPLEVIDTYLHSAAEMGFTGGKRLEESIWLTDARVLDPEGNAATNFTHREPIRVAFDFTAVRAVAGANLCMNLKDAKDRVVFRSEADLPVMPESLSPAHPLTGHAEGCHPWRAAHAGPLCADLLFPCALRADAFSGGGRPGVHRDGRRFALCRLRGQGGHRLRFC